ncbi:hypothetical protein D3C81_1900720 [compost metagenome]
MCEARARNNQMCWIFMRNRQANLTACKCCMNIDSLALAIALYLFGETDACRNCSPCQFVSRSHAIDDMCSTLIIASSHTCFSAQIAELYQT